jgi:CotH kinase protein/Lamin Tail Domain/Chitobiase/beta-hexosaminidase C-terminal domain
MILTIIIFILGSTLVSQANNLVINEIMSKNETILADQDGDYPDWIELYNSGEKIIFIKDYYLSDDKNNKIKWKFPNVEIQPKSFLLVFLSGKDKFENGEIHTNFKLDSDGEELFLSNNLDFELDRVPEISLGEDESFGRLPDGTGEFVRLANPSPNYSNNENDKLEISHKSGFYEKPFDLEIKSKSGYDIFYTLDGSVPTTKSQKYTKPIKMDYRYLDSNYLSEIPTTPLDSAFKYYKWKAPKGIVDKINIVRMASFSGGKRLSYVLSKSFFQDENVFSKYSLPLISISTDEKGFFSNDSGIYVPGRFIDSNNSRYNGNYFQKGEKWEREIHIEYFEKNGKLVFSQNAGVRINGKSTRRRAQKSLRIYARNKYGNNLFNYTLLPRKAQDKYSSFILRGTMGTWINSLFQDELAHDIVRELDFESQDFNPVIVYLNGEYWGIHALRERVDENFLARKYEVEKDDIILASSSPEYQMFLDDLEEMDLSKEEDYSKIQNKTDISSFIDYQIAEIYLNNTDWPENNYDAWKATVNNRKWRWIFFDLDQGFGDVERNMLEHATNTEEKGWPNPPRSTLLFRKLLENDEFKYLFITRFAELLKTTFQYHIVKEKFEMIKNMYSAEVPRHINRWNYTDSFEKWEEDIDKYLLKFLEERSCYMQEQIEEFFELDNFDFSCFFDYTDKDTIPTYQDKVELEFYDNIIKVENYYENLLNINVKVFALRGEEIYSGNYNISHGIERIDLGEKLIRGMYIISVEYLDTRKSFKIYKL